MVEYQKEDTKEKGASKKGEKYITSIKTQHAKTAVVTISSLLETLENSAAANYGNKYIIKGWVSKLSTDEPKEIIK